MQNRALQATPVVLPGVTICRELVYVRPVKTLETTCVHTGQWAKLTRDCAAIAFDNNRKKHCKLLTGEPQNVRHEHNTTALNKTDCKPNIIGTDTQRFTDCHLASRLEPPGEAESLHRRRR